MCTGNPATLTATGGGTYLWSTGATTPSISAATTGVYTVTVTSAAGCSASVTSNVTIGAPPTPSVTSATVCAGDNATLTASGGVSYVWSTGATTTSITTATAGTYTVTATNAGGCTATASGTVTVNPLPTPSVTSATVCAGNTATITASGGVSYIWSSGPTTPSITTGTGGIYTVTATDANSCSATASGMITVNPLPTPSVNDAAVCAGDNATLTATGGTSYLWSTGDVTPSITTATAGTYTVTASDANSCSATASGTVTVNPLPTPAVTNATVCSGDNATLTASGGIGYVWSTGDLTPSITTATAGTYTVTAADANGCTATASGTVTVNPLPTPSATSATVCAGNSGTLTASGGVSYLWSTGDVTASITVSAAGIYTVTATDANTCSATAGGTLTVNPLPTPGVSNAAVCTGSNATLTATGGTSYQWSTGDVTPSITTATAGTYTVTASDANSCSATASGTVTLNPLPVVSVNTTPALCSTASGTAIAIVSAGTPGYGYAWSAQGSTDDTLTGLSAGTYTVLVTDVNGCTATAAGVVSQLSPSITVNETSQHDLSCNNDASGAIYITATDIAGPGPFNFTYNWGSSGSQNLTGVQAGTYSVTVTDQFGCTGTATYTLTQPQPLGGTTASVNPRCFGQSNGSATLTPSGGSPNYTYSWSTAPAQTTAQAAGLPAGTYTVVLTDDSLCTATFTVTLTDPQQITFADSTITNPSCFGAANGSAQVAPQNGIGSYNYLWSTNPSQNVNPAVGLAAGSYIVTVTDANQCTASTTVTLIAPSQVSVGAVSTNVSCAGYNNGTATATATGGTPPYTYIWNNGDSLASISGLVASTYSVKATDANGCTADNSTTVTAPTAVSETLTSVRTNCPNTDDGSITATAGGGTGALTYTLENATGTTVIQSGNTTGSFTGIGYGLYTVVVTDANGCPVSDTITVPRAPFNYYTDTATGTSCYGSQYTDGTIHLQGYSIPNGPFQYSIDGGKTFQTTADFFNLAAGTYTIIAQDNYGCDTSFSIVVPEPLPATVQILPGDSTITAGTSLQLNTNFGPYSIDSIRSYSWSPGTGMSCIDCSSPQVSPYSNVTTYTVLVTYNQGCTVSASVQITVNGEPPVYVPNAFSPNGDGINDVWYVYGTGIKDIKAMIFDRWGEKVFETDDQSQGWDGRFRGQLQSPDVYIYLVNIVYLDGTTTSKQGSLSLIR